MFRKLSFILLILGFANVGFCQTKEIVDREIVLIKQVPQTTIKGKKRKLMIKADNHFKAIAKLDTLAVPYLIDRITDTTKTEITLLNSGRKLVLGDVAYALIIEIYKALPAYTAFGLQDCLLQFGMNDFDGLEWEFPGRKKTQDDLRAFCLSEKGRLWFKLFHGKKTHDEFNQILTAMPTNYR